MSEQQRSLIISFITTIFISLPLYAYYFSVYASKTFTTDQAFSFWASSILIIIFIRIIAAIAANIIAAISEAIIYKKEIERKNDERDNIISLKATRNSYYSFVGFFIAGVSIFYFTARPQDIFTILIIGGLIAELVQLFSEIFYYKRGH
jgi:hypothetical protein